MAQEELIATVTALLRLSRAQRALTERNRELEAAQEEAARTRAIAEQVLDLSIALTTAGTPREVADAVCRRAPAMFGAVGAIVARCAADGVHVELLGASDLADGVRAEWARFPWTRRFRSPTSSARARRSSSSRATTGWRATRRSHPSPNPAGIAPTPSRR